MKRTSKLVDRPMRKILWFVILCFSLFPVAAEVRSDAGAGREKCPVCGMVTDMFSGWNAKIEFKGSKPAVFCGPKCMFKYYLDAKRRGSSNNEEMAAILVKDYYSSELINARKAYYVVWSSVYGPMGHEPIPFERLANAEKFLKEQKGKKILRFNEVGLKLITSLDNPP